MMPRTFKWIVLATGAVVLVLLVLFTFLVLDSGSNQDRLVEQAISPGGTFVAEIYQITTPMHGGPDSVQVTLRGANEHPGNVIYSRIYECDDYSAFSLNWKGSNELVVQYGACDAMAAEGDSESIRENAVLQSDTSWRDVKITYRDAKYRAKR